MGSGDATRVAHNKIWWSVAILFVSTHVAALFGIWYQPPSVTPKATFVLAVVRWLVVGSGITIGYHRLYAHRSFHVGIGIRIILAIMGTSAAQGSIKWWCLRHRLHHRFTDDPVHDPYAATKGLWYSHMGWLFIKRRYERLNFIDQRDLQSDPVVQFQNRFYAPLVVLTAFIIPALIGALWNDALGAFIYGGLVTVVVCWHCSFLVNSLAHWSGLQPYSDENTSRGNLILALLTAGEGNHNFHTFPFDYRSDPSWLAWDPSKWIIRLLWCVGLVKSLRKATKEEIHDCAEYMRSKQGSPEVNIDRVLDHWNVNKMLDYVAEDEERCVLLIDGFVIDATEYMTIHPGGKEIMCTYRVPTRDLLRERGQWRECSLAFNGGLNNHSRLAHKRLKEMAVARLDDL